MDTLTPEQKAKELYTKFAIGGWGKENAITCCEEVIDAIRESTNIVIEVEFLNKTLTYEDCKEKGVEHIEYWHQVKSHLEQM